MYTFKIHNLVYFHVSDLQKIIMEIVSFLPYKSIWPWKNIVKVFSQLLFTCPKSTRETPRNCMNSVQS